MNDEGSPKTKKVGEETDSTPRKQAAEKKGPTDEEFIASWPLYSPAQVNGFDPPQQISFYCEGGCGKETTWTRYHVPASLSQGSPEKEIRSVAYGCTLCGKKFLTVVYRQMAWEHRVVGGGPSGNPNIPTLPSTMVSVLRKVLKVGQYPAQSISIPSSLEKNLGKDAAELYKKGLISRNSGYGLGAVVYIRRVVEDKTNELIEAAAQLAESQSVDAETVAKIRSTMSGKITYEEKIKLASTVIPSSFLIDGINPLDTLFGLVSQGIHELSEDRCLEIADETREVFEYLFTHLRATTEARKGFVEKVKKLTSKSIKSGQSSPPSAKA